MEARMVNKTYVFSSFLEFRSLEETGLVVGGGWGAVCGGEQFHDPMLPRAMAYRGVLKPLVLAPHTHPRQLSNLQEFCQPCVNHRAVNHACNQLR